MSSYARNFVAPRLYPARATRAANTIGRAFRRHARLVPRPRRMRTAALRRLVRTNVRRTAAATTIQRAYRRSSTPVQVASIIRGSTGHSGGRRPPAPFGAGAAGAFLRHAAEQWSRRFREVPPVYRREVTYRDS